MPARHQKYLTGNIPLPEDVAGTNAFKASVLDADGTSRTFELIFTKTANAQEWTAHINSSDSNITSATPSSGATEILNFGTSGELSETKLTHQLLIRMELLSLLT